LVFNIGQTLARGTMTLIGMWQKSIADW